MLAPPEHTTLPHGEDLDAVRATAQRAAALGVPELLRVRTRRPAETLLELVSERDAGPLVLGPQLARRLRRDAGCLVWVAPAAEGTGRGTCCCAVSQLCRRPLRPAHRTA